MSQRYLALFFAWMTFTAACASSGEPAGAGDTRGSTVSEPTGPGGGEPAPRCGNLESACSASDYCLVSKVPRLDRPDLIMTSECSPVPPGCAMGGARVDLCPCLTEDAREKNSNCAKLGASFDCHVRGGEGAPRHAEITCSFQP